MLSDMFANANLIAGRLTGWQRGTITASTPRTRSFSAHCRNVLAIGLRTYLAAYHRLEIVGRDHLPAAGPFVMISNHASHLDAVCLRAALSRSRLPDAFTAVAEDYFSANPFRAASASLLANAVPLSRQLHVRQGLRQCRSVLTADQSVLIFFPEGTRSRDGQLGAFRPGIGALLAGSNWPVVPCAIIGSFQAWPKGNRFAQPRQIRVIVGSPRQYDQRPRSRLSQHAIANDLRSAVEALLCK